MYLFYIIPVILLFFVEWIPFGTALPGNVAVFDSGEPSGWLDADQTILYAHISQENSKQHR